MLAEIMSDILSRYKDLDEPDFSFIMQIYDNTPYSEVIEDISNHFEVTEDTDLNYDRSFVYYLRKDKETYLLRISMVGKYAVVIDEHGKHAGLSTNTSRANLVLLKNILLNHHIVLVKPAILSHTVTMNLNLKQPTKVNLYQVLFDEIDNYPL